MPSSSCLVLTSGIVESSSQTTVVQLKTIVLSDRFVCDCVASVTITLKTQSAYNAEKKSSVFIVTPMPW